jgi:hypothetical protein
VHPVSLSSLSLSLLLFPLALSALSALFQLRSSLARSPLILICGKTLASLLSFTLASSLYRTAFKWSPWSESTGEASSLPSHAPLTADPLPRLCCCYATALGATSSVSALSLSLSPSQSKSRNLLASFPSSLSRSFSSTFTAKVSSCGLAGPTHSHSHLPSYSLPFLLRQPSVSLAHSATSPCQSNARTYSAPSWTPTRSALSHLLHLHFPPANPVCKRNRSTPPLSLKPTPPCSRSWPRVNRPGSVGWVAPIRGSRLSCEFGIYTLCCSLRTL